MSVIPLIVQLLVALMTIIAIRRSRRETWRDRAADKEADAFLLEIRGGVPSLPRIITLTS